jgi:hypothetical protein
VDACGLACGECAEGSYCDEANSCQACSCEGMQCGSNECCGECDEGFYCDDAYTCQACSCEGQDCGTDGCGNSCGECDVGELCNSEDLCEECTCAEEDRGCGEDILGCLCGECARGFCDEAAEPAACDRSATELCNNSCIFAGDEDCDDGGRGCKFSLCEFGSDCADCGERTEADRLPEGTDCPGE